MKKSLHDILMEILGEAWPLDTGFTPYNFDEPKL